MQALEGRLKRAQFHLAALHSEIEQFLSRDPYSTFTEPDPAGDGYVIRIAVNRSVPPTLGLIAADFVHNLRALLDNLVWSVATNALRRRRDLAFPLCSTPAAFEAFAKRTLGGMRVECLEAVERHQPFNRRPEDVANDRLLILHKMSNADKHHAPMGVLFWPVAAAVAAYGDHPLASDFTAHFGPVRDGQVVGRLTRQGAELDLHPRFRVDIGFKTRRPRLFVARHSLLKMHDIVANEVLPDFR